MARFSITLLESSKQNWLAYFYGVDIIRICYENVCPSVFLLHS